MSRTTIFLDDTNIDVVSASVHGTIPCTDTSLRATVARLRGQWADNVCRKSTP